MVDLYKALPPPSPLPESLGYEAIAEGGMCTCTGVQARVSLIVCTYGVLETSISCYKFKLNMTNTLKTLHLIMLYIVGNILQLKSTKPNQTPEKVLAPIHDGICPSTQAKQ